MKLTTFITSKPSSIVFSDFGLGPVVVRCFKLTLTCRNILCNKLKIARRGLENFPSLSDNHGKVVHRFRQLMLEIPWRILSVIKVGKVLGKVFEIHFESSAGYLWRLKRPKTCRRPCKVPNSARLIKRSLVLLGWPVTLLYHCVSTVLLNQERSVNEALLCSLARVISIIITCRRKNLSFSNEDLSILQSIHTYCTFQLFRTQIYVHINLLSCNTFRP